MHIALALKFVLHKIDLPASLDEGLRGRRGKSPETNKTVTQFRETSELTEWCEEFEARMSG